MMNIQKMLYELRKSKVIRLMLYPFMQMKLILQCKIYRYSEDAVYIRSLRDSHVRERCFIIGNGPSLIPEDLMKLKKEFCFATNRIFYMFDKVDWRPDIYLCTDNDILIKEIANIKKLVLKNKLVNLSAKKYGRTPEDSLSYINLYGRFRINKNMDVQTEVSRDVSNYFAKTRTVTCSCIELAMYMGFTEIYLLGVDHSYAITQYSDGRIVRDDTVKNYFDGMTGSEVIAIHPVDKATECYRVCATYAKENGVQICNVTRGGKLEVFDRKNLDEVVLRKNSKGKKIAK